MHALYVQVNLFYIIAAYAFTIQGSAQGDNFTSLLFTLNLSNTTTGYQHKFFKKINPYNCTNDTLCESLVPYKSWVTIKEISNITSLQHAAFPDTFNASNIRYALFTFLVEQYTEKGEYDTYISWQYLLENHTPINKWIFPLWSILTIAAILTSTITTIIIVSIKTRKKGPKKIVAINPANINIIPTHDDKIIITDQVSNTGSFAPTIVPTYISGKYPNEVEKPTSISIPLSENEDQKEEPKNLGIELPSSLPVPSQRLFNYKYTNVKK